MNMLWTLKGTWEISRPLPEVHKVHMISPDLLPRLSTLKLATQGGLGILRVPSVPQQESGQITAGSHRLQRFCLFGCMAVSALDKLQVTIYIRVMLGQGYQFIIAQKLVSLYLSVMHSC